MGFQTARSETCHSSRQQRTTLQQSGWPNGRVRGSASLLLLLLAHLLNSPHKNMSTYAEKRAASLARNKAALLAIDAGFGGRPVAPPPPPAPVAKVSKPKETKERRVSEVGTSSTSTSTSASGSRSSTRVRKAIQRFSSEKYSDEEEEYFSVGEDSGDEEHSDGERRNRRKSDSGSEFGALSPRVTSLTDLSAPSPEAPEQGRSQEPQGLRSHPWRGSWTRLEIKDGLLAGLGPWPSRRRYQWQS